MVNGQVISVKTGKRSGKAGPGIICEYPWGIFNFIRVSLNVTILKVRSKDFMNQYHILNITQIFIPKLQK